MVWRTIKALVVVCVLLWIVSGVYVIKADEAGVVKVFGRVLPHSVKPGIHYRYPYPVATVEKVKVTEVKSLKIGFETTVRDEETGKYFSYSPQELAEFLTGDENIVIGKLVVQWSISDPISYLTVVDDTEKLLKSLTESIFMEELSRMTVDDALTTKRARITNRIRDRLQKTLIAMNVGIDIVAVNLKELAPPEEVAAAFKEVASARGDASRMVHDAEGYKNEALPKARGEAQRLISEAQAYRDRVINLAKGEAERFEMLLKEYRKNPKVTERRLYLEMVDEVLPRVKKYVLSSKKGEEATKLTIFMDEL